MAVQKSIPLGSTGVNITVWRVVTKTESYIDQYVKATLDGYVDGDAADPVSPGGGEVVISGDAYVADMTKAQIEAAMIAPNVTATISTAVYDAGVIVAD